MIHGVHTVHELSNLWDLYVFEFGRMGHAFGKAALVWEAKDPAGYASFRSDFLSLGKDFSETQAPIVARVLALASRDSAPSWDIVPAIDPMWPLTGDAFNGLLNAFQGGETDSPGGFNDLDRRFRMAPPEVRRFAPDYSGIPKPDAPDLDLDAYRLADAAKKVIERITDVSLDVAGVVGLVLLAALAVRVAGRGR